MSAFTFDIPGQSGGTAMLMDLSLDQISSLEAAKRRRSARNAGKNTGTRKTPNTKAQTQNGKGKAQGKKKTQQKQQQKNRNQGKKATPLL